MKYSGMIPNATQVEQDGLLPDNFWESRPKEELLYELQKAIINIKYVSEVVKVLVDDPKHQMVVNKNLDEILQSIGRVNTLATVIDIPGINMSYEGIN